MFLITQEGRINISLKTGHSLDAYAFGMFVSDILDTRADLGTFLNTCIETGIHVIWKCEVWRCHCQVMCFLINFFDYIAVEMSTFVHLYVHVHFSWLFLCLPYQSTFFLFQEMLVKSLEKRCRAYSFMKILRWIKKFSSDCPGGSTP